MMDDARRPIHIALTATLAWLIVSLLVSEPHFPAGSIFGSLETVLPKDGWLVVFGLGLIIGVVGLRTPSRAMRVASVLVMASIHGAVAGVLVHQIPHSPPTGVFAVIAAQGYYLAWRPTR